MLWSLLWRVGPHRQKAAHSHGAAAPRGPRFAAVIATAASAEATTTTAVAGGARLSPLLGWKAVGRTLGSHPLRLRTHPLVGTRTHDGRTAPTRWDHCASCRRRFATVVMCCAAAAEWVPHTTRAIRYCRRVSGAVVWAVELLRLRLRKQRWPPSSGRRHLCATKASDRLRLQ